MGWTGTFMAKRPTGKQRIMFAIDNELEPEYVVDSALVGTTVYVAYKRPRIGRNDIICIVIETEYYHEKHEFVTKSVADYMMPCSCDCPKRILDKLTPSDSDIAMEWRRKCAERKA